MEELSLRTVVTGTAHNVHDELQRVIRDRGGGEMARMWALAARAKAVAALALARWRLATVNLPRDHHAAAAELRADARTNGAALAELRDSLYFLHAGQYARHSRQLDVLLARSVLTYGTYEAEALSKFAAKELQPLPPSFARNALARALERLPRTIRATLATLPEDGSPTVRLIVDGEFDVLVVARPDGRWYVEDVALLVAAAPVAFDATHTEAAARGQLVARLQAAMLPPAPLAADAADTDAPAAASHDPLAAVCDLCRQLSRDAALSLLASQARALARRQPPRDAPARGAAADRFARADSEWAAAVHVDYAPPLLTLSLWGGEPAKEGDAPGDAAGARGVIVRVTAASAEVAFDGRVEALEAPDLAALDVRLVLRRAAAAAAAAKLADLRAHLAEEHLAEERLAEPRPDALAYETALDHDAEGRASSLAVSFCGESAHLRIAVDLRSGRCVVASPPHARLDATAAACAALNQAMASTKRGDVGSALRNAGRALVLEAATAAASVCGLGVVEGEPSEPLPYAPHEAWFTLARPEAAPRASLTIAARADGGVDVGVVAANAHGGGRAKTAVFSAAPGDDLFLTMQSALAKALAVVR
ncbi:hypothetical protein M885DRAFT_537366 [Pelagophyceae sp. CCMP2097]|nr:hypothetical protein M885DRAFT_537366 [Pelagophyceae sp. CCMP2097]